MPLVQTLPVNNSMCNEDCGRGGGKTRVHRKRTEAYDMHLPQANSKFREMPMPC